MKSKPYTQSKRPLDKNQSSKFCQSGVKQIRFQNLKEKRKWFFLSQGHFKAIGLDTSKLGLHSFRIGVASAAINNDLPDRMVKKHGRWKTDKAKDLYCRENINHQLMVSLN